MRKRREKKVYQQDNVGEMVKKDDLSREWMIGKDGKRNGR
jgi:hypothetical protein